MDRNCFHKKTRTRPKLAQRICASFGISFTLVTTLSTFPVSAQLSGLSNPAIIERSLKDPEVTRPAPAPIQLEQGSTAPAGSEDIFFTLRNLRLTGGTLFDAEILTSLNMPQTGTRISVADIYLYADAITRYYREQGYALSFAVVPAQEISTGDVRLEIVEGTITDLRIRETRLSDLARRHILDAFASLASKGVTKTDDLERFLLSVNEYPGISARGVIAPGDATGTAALILEVDQRTQQASLGYQNYLSESLGRDVFLADVALLGQWTGRDEARLSVRQAPDPKTYRSVSFDYSTYIDDSDLQLFIRTSESHTKPEKGTLADLDFSSHAYSKQIGMRYPLILQRRHSLTVGGSVNMADSASYNGTTPSSQDKTRNINVYADYEIDLPSGASHLFRVELERGLTFFQARANSRQGADLNHSIVRLSERYRQPLLPLEKGQLDATLRLFAQASLSDRPVFSNAECTFGGRGFGIGLDAGTLAGEHCFVGSLQLSWQRALTNISFLPDSVFTLFGRFDAGSAKQGGTLTAGERRQQEAMSAAIGAQFVLDSGMTVNLEQATQLKNEPEPLKEGESQTNISVNMPF